MNEWIKMNGINYIILYIIYISTIKSSMQQKKEREKLLRGNLYVCSLWNVFPLFYYYYYYYYEFLYNKY